MKTKFDKKIVSSLIISLFSTQMMHAVAQGVSTQPSATNATAPTIGSLPALVALDPSVAPVDCNKEIMQNLNSTYLRERGQARIVQYNNEMNGLVLTTPKANQMDCFQQAMQNIKNLMSAINSIIAMFSGQMDMDAIMQQMVNMVLKAACQEINQVTGAVSGSLSTYTNGINSTLGTVTNTQLGVGGVGGSVGDIIAVGNGTVKPVTTDYIGGSTTSVTNTINTIGSTVDSATNTGSALINKIESVSPFSSGTSK